MKKLKVFSLMMALCMIFSFAACSEQGTDPKPDPDPIPTPTVEKLATPQNVFIDAYGYITWDSVAHATQYVVTVGTEEHVVSTTYYQAESIAEDFTFSVAARAEGYDDSDPATGSFKGVVLAISASGDIRSGQRTMLTASVGGVQQQVTWTVTKGSEYASISSNGYLTAEEVEQDTRITVRATSERNSSLTAERSFTIFARPALTQDMIDALAEQSLLRFDGVLTVNRYNVGITQEFVDSYEYEVVTAMDGSHWYAEYYDGALGETASLYCADVDGVASQVSLSFMNTAEYTPMLDDSENEIGWEDAGYYNNFSGLTVADFTFNEESWMWEYTGEDTTLMQRMIASANPYDFEPESLALVIEEGEIMGIHMVALPSLTVSYGYNSIQEYEGIINYGEGIVDVPVINSYPHDELHDILNTALDNMRKLTNYTLEFRSISQAYGTSYTISGYTETITPDMCFFSPFDSVAGTDDYIDTYTGEYYGYKKINDGLYNTFFRDANGYAAGRAFEGDFSEAKPTFAFAAEIFTGYSYDAETEEYTFYVDDPMNTVASMFYQGIGSDMQLYGMFATRGYISATQSFTPYVTVRDGYIVDAGFYFYLGNMSGVIELTYSDFGTAALPAEAESVSFATKYVPASWSELLIYDSPEGTEEVAVNAAEYLQEFLGVDNADEALPVFDSVLGDCYGFGMTTYQSVGGSNNLVPCVMLYYDVLLDEDYTITSSLKAAETLLEESGFVRNEYGEYTKGNVRVAIVDNNLDFTVYVWKNTTAN